MIAFAARAGIGVTILLAMKLEASGQNVMTSKDLLALPQPAADATVSYGPAPQHQAELRLPKGKGPHPVVIVIHGGCWETPWGLDHVRSLAAALTAEGFATWSLEYRRLGDDGGGWPGTLEDVARGADHLRSVAAANRLDLKRVVAIGHSAGGQLALWLASRPALPEGSPLRGSEALRLRGVVALAGVTDLRAGAATNLCGDAIPRLLGGSPAEQAERVRLASPIARLPLGVPQRLVCGARDSIVPIEQARAYEKAARAAGDDVRVEVVPGAGHFELVNPASAAWPVVRAAVRGLVLSR